MPNTILLLSSTETANTPAPLVKSLQKGFALNISPIAKGQSSFDELCQSIINGEADAFCWNSTTFPEKLPDGIDFFGIKSTNTYITFKMGHDILTRLRNFFCPPVAFIGAGPGELEWITVEGKRLLEECDICFYDALANPLFIASLPKHITRYYVGKRGDSSSFDQAEINRLIALHCRKGDKVVRLKGGDSGIFGRLNEEIDELSLYQLPYTITPGISAMQSLPSQVGVFLTRRGMADRVTLCSGRKAGGAISDPHPYDKGTLVIYMGVLSIEQICQALLAANYQADMPAAIAVNLSRPGQKLIQSTLAELPKVASDLNLRPPGLLIFGEAAAEEMQCIPPFSPLLGRRILLAGSDKEIEECGRELRRFGARTMPFSLFASCQEYEDIGAPDFDDVVLFSPESALQFFNIVKEKKVQPKGAFVTTNKATDAAIQCLMRHTSLISDSTPASIIQSLQAYQMIHMS